MSGVIVRPMREDDAEAVLAIQALAYPPSHHESWAVLGGRLRLWSPGCWVADGGAQLLGYVVSHPWCRAQAVPLHGVLAALPQPPDSYHLHDLALHPQARGRGIAARLVEHVEQAAMEAGLHALTLVSVPGAQAFWSRMGFRPLEAGAPSAYGASAVAMGRLLPGASRPSSHASSA